MPILDTFYSAFAAKDADTMARCYHADAHFSDPVFPDLDAKQAKAMWRMLLSGGSDLRTTYTVLRSDDRSGTVRWEAWYTFGPARRPVHNIVTSTFTLRDGLILQQRDRFDFWRWSRQALGTTGLLLGWSPLVRNKVQRTAADRLAQAMRS